MPKRIQRKRTKGWRMPENTVNVARPSRYGNPYVIGDNYTNPFDDAGSFEITRENCLDLFRVYAKGKLAADPNWLKPLRGKDVACFCKETEACHGDILIELSN